MRDSDLLITRDYSSLFLEFCAGILGLVALYVFCIVVMSL